jgi:Ca-activated chloride channel family protein
MQILADKGNGNHAYIDNIMEAKKTLVTEFVSTIHTLAKDVKIQIEFNPQYIKAYKLIGYENRLLNKEDFNDDTKDAGEMGAGHSVTALYEIIPTGSKNKSYDVDDLKYQKYDLKTINSDLATIKFRYKDIDSEVSKKIEKVVAHQNKKLESCQDDIRFSIAVACFGIALRKTDHLPLFDMAQDLAKKSIGKDEFGFRKEFLNLVESAKLLNKNLVKNE